MAITETKYYPSENGAPLSGGTGANYFRLEVKHTYDPVANTSELAVTAQVKCTSNIAPSGLYITEGKVTVGSVQVLDLASVGSSRRIKPLYSTMNAWVNVGLNGSVYTGKITIPASSHATSGAFSVAIAFTKVRVFVDNSSLNAAADASSGTLNFTPSRAFTLTISAGIGSLVTVKRGSTTLNTGDSVTYGETLTVTFAAQTGYSLTSSSVSGATHGSGSSYTVTGPMTAAATAAKIAYTLTISQGPNSTIKVTRNGSVLSTGATVYYGDQLAITMTANSGHHLTTATVSGATVSGGYYVVGGNVTVTTVAAGNDKTLRILTAEGVSVSVTRGGVSLSDNADIAVDDVLTIIATAATGYENAAVTVTGATKGSGDEYTVTDDVTVTPSATKISYTLTLSPATGSSISVMRGSEELHDGDTIYYGDALVISAAPDSGYGILTLTVNGSPFANGATHVVSAAVTVATTTEELVGAYLKLAAGWARYAAYINAVAGWGRYIPYIQTTTGWVKY